MKIFLNLFLFLFVLVIFENKSHSLTDYKIKEICKKKARKSNCIKSLQDKRTNLQKGNIIEIPVIPFKSK